MKKFFVRLLWTLGILLVTGAILYFARVPIMKGFGKLLIKEDANTEVEAAFMLSSNALERGKLTADLYQRKLFPRVVTMGEGINASLLAMGIERTDAQVARQVLIDLGVDSTAIRTINRGTSTYEESEQILGYADREGYHHIMVVTSKFHTRRVKKVFGDKFRAKGIEVIVKGAEPENYEIDRWWESEEALIFVNNEYIKHLYYWWKY